MAESGTHEELLKQGAYSNSPDQGIYCEMWQKQLREDNDTDSASTIGETKIKDTDFDSDKDGKATTEHDVPTHPANNKPAAEARVPALNQHQHDATKDPLIESQQSIDSGAVNPTQVEQENGPGRPPRIDIPSKDGSVADSSPLGDNPPSPHQVSALPQPGNSEASGTPLSVSPTSSIPDGQQYEQQKTGDNENKGAPTTASPTGSILNDPQNEDTGKSTSPTASVSNDRQNEQQQSSDKDSKTSKSKNKNKNKKNRKRKSTRNSTTFR